MDRLPIIYVRGYAGPTAGIDMQVDDPFYGFNRGATHIRVDGDGDPSFYQFEGPMLRLMVDEGYRLLVHGDQQRYLQDQADGSVPPASLWVYRFYDQAATTFVPPLKHEGVLERVYTHLHREVTADGFDIETAAAGLYELIQCVRLKTGAPKVFLVAHSMGGLVARCMMQKLCRDGHHESAKELVARFFTYGTPHGGISFDLTALDWAEQAFGPAGADIFAPPKMFGYLTPGKEFGDVPKAGDKWDPQEVPADVFSPDDIFCLVGTDPKDYGLAKVVVGPKSDGLVRIEHAYVRHAHRAYVYKSHSGTYGEVNSEEGYQNLRRFLFGRWAVSIEFAGLPPYSAVEGQSDGERAVWQADMRLVIRGLPVVISEQLASHWCPIQLNEELKEHVDTPDAPVPLVTTYLLYPKHQAGVAEERNDPPHEVLHGGRARYVLSLAVYQLHENSGFFRFQNHLEQVPDWTDALIVDVGETDGTLAAWAAWNGHVPGPNEQFDPITDGLPEAQRGPLTFTQQGTSSSYQSIVDLPLGAKHLPALGSNAHLTIRVTDRLAATRPPLGPETRSSVGEPSNKEHRPSLLRGIVRRLLD